MSCCLNGKSSSSTLSGGSKGNRPVRLPRLDSPMVWRCGIASAFAFVVVRWASAVAWALAAGCRSSLPFAGPSEGGAAAADADRIRGEGSRGVGWGTGLGCWGIGSWCLFAWARWRVGLGIYCGGGFRISAGVWSIDGLGEVYGVVVGESYSCCTIGWPGVEV